MLRWRPPSREARLANHQVARIAGGDLCPRTRRAWVSWNPGESGSILSLRAWDGPHTCCVVFRPRRYGETQQLGPSIVVRRAVTSGPRCHRMMFFPGGKVRDVSESFLSVPEKRASMAAEPRNAAGAGTSSWLRGRDLSGSLSACPESGLATSRRATTQLPPTPATRWGGCPTIRKQTAPPAISRPRGNGLRLPLEFRLLGLDRFSHYLAGHDSRHVS